MDSSACSTRDDGYCWCKHCGFSGMFMQPLHPCTGCGTETYKQSGHDKDGCGYCKPCYDALPDDKLSESSLRLKAMLKRMRDGDE